MLFEQNIRNVSTSIWMRDQVTLRDLVTCILCHRIEDRGAYCFCPICRSILLSETLTLLITFEQWALELWYFTWVFLVIRSSYWYQNICPCDLSHLWNWPIGGICVSQTHLVYLWFFLESTFSSAEFKHGFTGMWFLYHTWYIMTF